MARSVPSRGVGVGGLSTPLATVALVLAAQAPGADLWILATDGGQACRPAPSLVGVTTTSREAVERSLRPIPFPELILSIVPRYQPFELMRPAQLDRCGRSNNVAITSAKGRLRLPGCGGIADATSVNGSLHYYLPRHDPRTLVERVEFVSGAGRAAATGRLPPAPAKVITELCEMRFTPEGPVVTAIHPGVGVSHIRAQTGFKLSIPSGVPMTEPVTDWEAEALGRIDPLRVRDLEFLSGAERRRHLDRIVEAERRQACEKG